MSATVGTPAWSLTDLKNRLAAKGLPVLETGVEEMLDAVMDWTEYGLINDDKSWNDPGVVLIPLIKKAYKGPVDGIDGQPG